MTTEISTAPTSRTTGYDAEHTTRQDQITSRRSSRRALAALLLIVALVAAGDVWWLNDNRKGLPFNIDESGYLQRAVLFQQQIAQHGIAGLFDVWRRPDIVGPLMPLTAGLVRLATGADMFSLLCSVQLFFGLTVFGAYLLARHFCRPGWSLAIGAVTACLPGLLDGGREFLLAEPCAALFVLLIAVQFRIGRFSSFGWSVLWGVLLGLTSLTRTMVLALIAAPLAVEAVRLLVFRPSGKQVRNASIGGFIAFVVGGSWYWTSWGAVQSYLTTYGYGKLATKYGSSRSMLTWSWWLSRLINIVDEDLYAPIVIAVVLLASIGALRVVAKSRRSRRNQAAPARGRPAVRLLNAIRVVAGNDLACLALIVAGCYLALSTSANSGSYFELPLAAPLVCLLLVPIDQCGRTVVAFGSVLLALAGGITLLDQMGFTPALQRWSTVTVGPISATSFAVSSVQFTGTGLRGALLSEYSWTDCGGATISCFYGKQNGITLGYLNQWTSTSTTVLDYVEQYARDHQRSPVVFFAYQGPLLNTNSVALVAQLRGISLPIGALQLPEFRDGASLVEQLQAPQYGQPNIVIAGATPPSTQHWRGTSNRILRSVQTLLREQGFQLIQRFNLPQAPSMEIWWTDR